ncbi:8391_t:CDS:2 [Dentiscutata erythropus]|uniref:8391_t:CDS:1 n=1 Tax=Dentiscutata erythropus TaxID=1348616 RepID=A0A9N9B379_9GLOM|nr:8391_t:CDS:2 [Dentiscutata erythropus]
MSTSVYLKSLDPLKKWNMYGGIKSSLEMFFDNLNIEDSTNKTADLIKAAEISDDKHMELEENDDGNNGNSRSGVLPISKQSQDRQFSSTTVQSHNTANEPTITSTSDGEENKEETTLLPTNRVKRKIIVTSSEEQVEQSNNRKNWPSRAARYLAQRTTPQTSRHKSTSSNSELPIEEDVGKRKNTIPTASRKKQPKISEES